MSVAWEEYGNYATDVFTRQAVNVIEVSDFNHLPPILCCCHPLSPNLRLLTLILSGAQDKPIAISYAYCHLSPCTSHGVWSPETQQQPAHFPLRCTYTYTCSLPNTSHTDLIRATTPASPCSSTSPTWPSTPPTLTLHCRWHLIMLELSHQDRNWTRDQQIQTPSAVVNCQTCSAESRKCWNSNNPHLRLLKMQSSDTAI